VVREVRDLRAIGELDAEPEHVVSRIGIAPAGPAHPPEDHRIELVFIRIACQDDEIKLEEVAHH
jgi:hypothetical protein